ncbi:MAG TPA: 30S ribosomal protein S20, partial [Gemmatimonadetes bacterium]|nr:30S ribosomal protein S20 [Gemmatimonadota bacterium]
RLRAAVAVLDRAATARIFHPNRVARVKGQLARHVNSLS